MSGTDKPTVLIASYFPRSLELEGQGTFVRGLSVGMAERGWEVHILLPEGRTSQFDADAIHTYRTGGMGGVRNYMAALERHSHEANATISLENNPSWALLASRACPLDRTLLFFLTPAVQLRETRKMGWSRQALLHGIGKNPFWSRLQSWGARRCAAATEYQARQLRDYGAREVHVLPGCAHSRTPSAPAKQDAREALGWDDTPVIGYLGHYSRAKGVDVLVEAFAGLSGPGQLALAYSGKGALGPAGQRSLEALRASGRVRELGVVDVPTFLAACDAIALPYLTSSVYHLPMVLLEAYAAGVPVVTTRVGGVPEVVSEDETGWLVAPRDAQALATKIEQVLATPDDARRLGANARAQFETALCREVLCERLSQLLSSTPGGPGDG